MATANSENALQRANRLYWDSEQTVDEIVDGLDISRNALYSNIRPVPAGATCADCGERMVFTNRTNRSQGVATCSACGAEHPAPEAPSSASAASAAGERPRADEAAGKGARPAGGPRILQESWQSWRGELRYLDVDRVLLFGGAAVLGVAAGVAVARSWRS